MKTDAKIFKNILLANSNSNISKRLYMVIKRDLFQECKDASTHVNQ
jgi:hypothetical protein